MIGVFGRTDQITPMQGAVLFADYYRNAGGIARDEP